MNSMNLSGQFLIAMPTLADTRFSHSVVYMCTHNATGAMGLIINRNYGAIDIKALFEQLKIETGPTTPDMAVYYGGPVEPSRGFILHSDDYVQDTSMRVHSGVALTATMDILKAIAGGTGPARVFLCLGYSGWEAGQLETEIQAGSWLVAPHDTDLIFDRNLDTKWERAIGILGFSPGLLSSETGHA